MTDFVVYSINDFLENRVRDKEVLKASFKEKLDRAMKATKENLAKNIKQFGNDDSVVVIIVLKNIYKLLCLIATEADSSVVFKQFDLCFEILPYVLEQAEEAVRDDDDDRNVDEKNYLWHCDMCKKSHTLLTNCKKDYKELLD
tara:strand:+ start:208 stop:636 length:429 start_codon:yes stop_codon:yes gene_type:complete